MHASDDGGKSGSTLPTHHTVMQVGFCVDGVVSNGKYHCGSVADALWLSCKTASVCMSLIVAPWFIVAHGV